MSVEPHGVETANCPGFVQGYQHGLADRVGDFDQRHYNTGLQRLDNLPVASKPVQVADEAGAPAANQFDMGKPRHINVGGKVVSAHDFPRPGLVGFLAQTEANHAVHGCAIGLSRNRCHQTQNVSRRGFESVNGTATIGRSTPANTNITYPKITIADFDIPHSQVPAQDSLGTAHNASWCDKSKAAHPASTEPRADANLNDGTPTGQIGIEVVTGRRDGHPIPHLMLPHLPASDAPGNVFVAPLTLSGTTL